MRKTIRIALSIILIAGATSAVAALLCGCGSGSGSNDEDGCVKNPWLCYQGVYFVPADGATNVAYDATVFKTIFAKGMDTSITPTDFSMTIQRQDTGNYFTITNLTYLSYGTFSWTSTHVTNDTLSLSTYTKSYLDSNSLNSLEASKRYTVTYTTLPTNLRYADGAVPDFSRVHTSSSFTTKSSD